MIAVLQELIRRERLFFGKLQARLKEFESRQNENETLKRIYLAYYDSYSIGAAALWHWEKAVSDYSAGNQGPLQEIAGPNFPAPRSSSGGMILAIVACTRLPSDLFKRRLRFHIREICRSLLYLLTYTPDSPDLQADIETIGSLLCTFEHVDIAAEETQKGSTILPFASGVALGAVAREGVKIIWQQVKGSI